MGEFGQGSHLGYFVTWFISGHFVSHRAAFANLSGLIGHRLVTAAVGNRVSVHEPQYVQTSYGGKLLPKYLLIQFI